MKNLFPFEDRADLPLRNAPAGQVTQRGYATTEVRPPNTRLRQGYGEASAINAKSAKI